MNSFGRIFTVSIYGESHGTQIGVVIDGCPPGISIKETDFIHDIERRKPKKKGTTKRKESDKVIISSGVYNNFSSGSPIHISFLNENHKSEDYNTNKFRPGHADFTSSKKYNNYNNLLGGGHLSGRLTLALLAAGVIAKKIVPKVKINAYITQAGGEQNIDLAVEKAIEGKDSIGAVVKCEIIGLETGFGEPFFDSLESLIAHAAFSIPGLKAIEFGNGIKSASQKGSEFNDLYIDTNGKTKTNNAGGINGGISNGNDIYFNLYFKPTPSIAKPQKTINFESGEIEELTVKGRHDVCYALRVPAVVEAITAIVVADLFLINKSIYK